MNQSQHDDSNEVKGNCDEGGYAMHTFMRKFFEAIDNRTHLFYDDGRI